MTITLKISIFNPMSVKPKYVWEAYILLFENHKKTANKNVNYGSQTQFCFINIGLFESPFRHKIGDVVQIYKDFESFRSWLYEFYV